MKLTAAQARALRRAVEHGGSLTLGGMDDSGVRRDVVLRLVTAGLLRVEGGSMVADDFKITDAGRAALGSADPIRLAFNAGYLAGWQNRDGSRRDGCGEAFDAWQRRHSVEIS